jgi:hypothetical protein
VDSCPRLHLGLHSLATLTVRLQRYASKVSVHISGTLLNATPYVLLGCVCAVLRPGYYGQTPGTPAQLCPRGTFYAGGPAVASCISCGGRTTRDVGSTSAAACGECCF